MKKFEEKTQVGIVWSFARLNLQSDEQIEEIFDEIKEEITPKLTKLSEKSLAMLLWSYSKVESPDELFLERIKACITGMSQPFFDHFDLTLIVQACKVFEGSFLIDRKDFMSTTMSMLNNLESHVVKNITNMNVHQFMTV